MILPNTYCGEKARPGWSQIGRVGSGGLGPECVHEAEPSLFVDCLGQTFGFGCGQSGGKPSLRVQSAGACDFVGNNGPDKGSVFGQCDGANGFRVKSRGLVLSYRRSVIFAGVLRRGGLLWSLLHGSMGERLPAVPFLMPGALELGGGRGGLAGAAVDAQAPASAVQVFGGGDPVVSEVGQFDRVRLGVAHGSESALGYSIEKAQGQVLLQFFQLGFSGSEGFAASVGFQVDCQEVGGPHVVVCGQLSVGEVGQLDPSQVSRLLRLTPCGRLFARCCSLVGVLSVHAFFFTAPRPSVSPVCCSHLACVGPGKKGKRFAGCVTTRGFPESFRASGCYTHPVCVGACPANRFGPEHENSRRARRTATTRGGKKKRVNHATLQTALHSAQTSTWSVWSVLSAGSSVSSRRVLPFPLVYRRAIGTRLSRINKP